MRYVYAIHDPPQCDGLDCSQDEVLVRQEFKEECDINRIVGKYADTGMVPQVDGAMYGDFSSPMDFMSAQDVLLRARTQFESLDSVIRARFGNDPVKFLEFVGNKENIEECRKLGFFKPAPVVPPKAKPMEVIVVKEEVK